MNDLKLRIDNKDLDFDINSDFPITFNYLLEDTQDFQRKKSSESIGLNIPATLNNQEILKTFHNTSINNNTYKNIRNITVEAGGIEIFVGKVIPKKAIKRGNIPISYELNCFGNNADWIIDLKELTLYELLKHINFTYDQDTIIKSWGFDGTNESLPYVFAPVKYGGWLDPKNSSDTNYVIDTMKPSLSIYWILYWGFKMAGYKIESVFFDTPYFRRMVIPWSYGAFLTSEGTKYKIHYFLAKTLGDEKWFSKGSGGRFEEFVNLDVRDNADSGCYDSNNTISEGDYTGSDTSASNQFGHHGGGIDMKWKYNTPHYGKLQVMFSINIFYDYLIDMGSDMRLEVHWYHKNSITGQVVEYIDPIRDNEAPSAGSSQESETRIIFREFLINPNDEISSRVWLRLFRSKTATVCRCKLRVDEFTTKYFKVPVGGDISFDSYLTFQKEKYLDVLSGIIDLFNLSIQTDPVNKIVVIEPTHDYSINKNISKKTEGYFRNKNIDWTDKEDISEYSSVEIYDDNSREFVFKFKDDDNDGALKIVQDRYKITLGAGKYVFSERFKAEKKEFENRYFSPTMHYLVDDFSKITGQAPQMVCLVPENISNTSSPEAQNVFKPKICYYKGVMSGVGGWRFNGKDYKDYPYMFAVNYKSGGDNDPILSYTDERIGIDGTYTIGVGLLKRFFWQRLAIMNNGQWLTTQFDLNNKDIINWFHRERIAKDGELWELLSIKEYNSLDNKSTKCVLRKWVPITKIELDNTYPSESSVLKDSIIVTNSIEENNGNEIDKIFDTQYNGLMCLYNDIPR